MSKKIALITGVTGQDGSYLAELLLKKGYEVHGIKRRASSFNTQRIDHIYEDEYVRGKNFFLHYGDLSDSLNIYRLISEILPDEVYNLGAQSHVAVSFESPEYTSNVDALGTLRILEAIKSLRDIKKIKFYQASTSELYGEVIETPQNEDTPFNPMSPYAVSKLYSFYITLNYRKAYDLFACNGILFNHESPRRGETFVTRKITMGLANIICGNLKCLYLGNLYAKRDWGHAKDFVEMQWLMLQQKTPKDYVIATGEQYSVKDFIDECCKHIGIKLAYKGTGTNEIGYIDEIFNNDYKKHIKKNMPIIKVHPDYFRPSEVETLLGDSSKALKDLNWSPKTSFQELCKEMIMSDIENTINK
jgi:GDPmannose 4,6-dehydratase